MLNRKDFMTDQEVRWCPGCGDYAILATMQRTLPTLGIPRENIVFISGIGCAGRFPYYMNTYGFHTLHGRAPAVATGLKLTRPELSVWVITGDGDGLSIGANHLLHLFRRNIDVKVLLFNNQIYGLTKGQASPTSPQGKISNTSPAGTIDRPLDPVTVALSAGATFVARALDVDAKGLGEVIAAAAQHKGSALIEIYQNCNIFNDGVFKHLSDKSLRAENTVYLENNKPLLYGEHKNKSIAFENLHPVIKENITAHLYQHNPQSYMHAQLLAQLNYPEFPVPLGIFYQVARATYEEGVAERTTSSTDIDINAILLRGIVWEAA